MSTQAQLALVAQPRPQRPVTAIIPVNDQLEPSSEDDDLYRMRSTSLSSGHQADFRIVVSPEPQLQAPNFPSNLPTRTPSPTLSEHKALLDAQISPLDYIWKRFSEKARFSRENITPFLVLIIVIAVIVIIAVLNKQIVEGLQPARAWLLSNPYGFLIPIAVLFVLSFPPLLGHEIVGVLLGMFYGLGLGFAIAVIGQLLGESANFLIFKYMCTGRGQKLRNKNIDYAALARAVEEGGFLIILLPRYSVIPQHITTALFAAAGIPFRQFLLTYILSTPKIFLLSIVVGFSLEAEAFGLVSKGTSLVIAAGVTACAVILSFIALWYIKRKVNLVMPQVVYERRKQRQRIMPIRANSDSPKPILENHVERV